MGAPFTLSAWSIISYRLAANAVDCRSLQPATARCKTLAAPPPLHASWPSVMTRLRRGLAPLALVWAVVHVAMPVSITAMVVSSPAALRELECTCRHGADHGQCPMHHRSTDATRCRMQSAQDDPVLAGGLILSAAVMPRHTELVTLPQPSPCSTVPAAHDPIDSLIPPDAPPPRV
jgi:hypothetical protein